MGLLQINAAQLLPYLQKEEFIYFLCVDKISSYNQTPAMWLVTITSQTDVWTLTNEWFSEGSFLFYRGWGFRNLAEFISLSPQLRPGHHSLNCEL